MRILHLVSYAVFSGPVAGVVGLARAQRALGHQVHVAFDRRRGAFSPYEEALCTADHLAAEASTTVMRQAAAQRQVAVAPQALADPQFVVDPPALAHQQAHAEACAQPATLAGPAALAISPKAGPFAFCADVVRLRRLVHRNEVDVLHAHLSHDHWLTACVGRSAPCRVRTVHASRVLAPRWGQRWLWQQTDGVVLRTAAHLAALPAAGVPADVARQVVVGGIDTDAFAPSSGHAARVAARQRVRQALGVPPTAQLLLHVALMAGRGQEELLHALAAVAARVPDVHVVLVGLGPARAALVEQVAALRLQGRVHFVGYLRAAALQALYRGCDAAFVAQPGNDAAARAALEAMAAALPIIAVKTEALAELVDDVSGYPVATRTPTAIAQGLQAWSSNPARGHARGRAGRRRMVRERSFVREAEVTHALYAAAAARRSSRR